MDQDEIRILEAMVDEHQHVSFERILSGAGMVSLYRAIAKINGEPIEVATPEQIVSGAVSQLGRHMVEPSKHSAEFLETSQATCA